DVALLDARLVGRAAVADLLDEDARLSAPARFGIVVVQVANRHADLPTAQVEYLDALVGMPRRDGLSGRGRGDRSADAGRDEQPRQEDGCLPRLHETDPFVW